MTITATTTLQISPAAQIVGEKIKTYSLRARRMDAIYFEENAPNNPEKIIFEYSPLCAYPQGLHDYFSNDEWRFFAELINTRLKDFDCIWPEEQIEKRRRLAFEKLTTPKA